MLRALDDLFDLDLGHDRLADLASELGSDVPFLVHGGSAVVEGLGERIQVLPTLPDVHAVLVFPEAPCPTGAVYGKFDLMRPDAAVQSARVHALAAQRTLSDDAPFNDLAAPALAVEPILEDDVADVRAATGRTVHVSGSGSTLYVLCNGRLEADLLAEQVRSRSGLPAVAASVRGL
jgi:4-diphosphocytidyl-2-C-methyl-D-erythritol kinase